MALVDDIKIRAKAGNGGNGGQSFKKLYADGGNGGRGGSIYFQGSHNVSDLSQFRFVKEIKAEDGQIGMHKNLTGKHGEDLYVFVPFGTSIYINDEPTPIEILYETDPVLIVQGGRGGGGSKTNYTEGTVGGKKDLHLILNLIADIGFIGLPNAGKSSLLSTLTNANPKIGNYPFTTLVPNLGTIGEIILADIPGLIEGASEGHGLGVRFLKHIEKTKVLMHCIDASNADPLKAYKTVRDEFKKYNLSLLSKEEIILLTKIDLTSEKEIKNQIKILKSTKKKIIPVSIYNEKDILTLKKTINRLGKKFKDNIIIKNIENVATDTYSL